MAACGTYSKYTQGCRCLDCKEATRIHKQSYYARNQDKLREKSRAVKPEKRKDYKARHFAKPGARAKNRKYVSMRRQVMRAAVTIPYTFDALQQRLSYFGNKCYLKLEGCLVVGDQVEHVKPLSKGGYNMLGNIRPACGPCNLRKAAKWPFIF